LQLLRHTAKVAVIFFATFSIVAASIATFSAFMKQKLQSLLQILHYSRLARILTKSKGFFLINFAPQINYSATVSIMIWSTLAVLNYEMQV